jgi:two-component system NtrC family sensor kinase
MVADDARTVARLEAELRAIRSDNASLRRRELALIGELAEACGQQAAMLELLRLLTGPPPDLQPAFEIVARSAAVLCDAVFSGVHLFDGQGITLDAQHNIRPDELELLQRQVFPLRPERQSAVGRAVHDRRVVHIPDIRSDPGYRLPVLQASAGFRTVLAVPMLREGIPVGIAPGLSRLASTSMRC